MNAERTAVALAAMLWCQVILATPARAIDFFFLYDDAPGTGFLDPVLGQQRRDALQAAGDVWGRLIRPAYEGEEITVRSKFDSYDPGSTTLASAAPHFYYSDFDSSSLQYVSDTNYPKALANHLNLGDLAPVRHEIEITFNVAQPFYLGADGMPGAGQFDFVTVAAHELGHGLGFTSSIREGGDYGIFGDGTYAPGPLCDGCLPTPYDRSLALAPSGGAPLLSLSSDARENALVSNNVFWNGANAATGNGGAPVKIHAPSAYQEGSSTSHVDSATFPNALMGPSIGRGVARQTLSAFERGMLRDMGWNISVASQEVSWTGAGGNNNASTAGNWSPALPLPGDDLAFGSAGAAGPDVNMDLTLYSLGAIRFAENAPAYTLRFKPWTDTDLTGIGVERDLVGSQTIILESRPAPNTGPGQVYDGSAAKMAFKNTASAGNGTYELRGGSTGIHSNPPLEPTFNRTLGAGLTFDGTSSAELAHFNVEGGAGNGALGAQVTFQANSTAGDAELWNQAGRSGISLPLGTTQAGFGGETRFEDNSRGGNANLRNDGVAAEARLGTGGRTTFADASNAENATVNNFGVTGLSPNSGGVTEFTDMASAGNGTFTNHPGRVAAFNEAMAGRTAFFDHTTAGDATIVNEGSTTTMEDAGATHFRGHSSAGMASITNRSAFASASSSGGVTRFYDEATAGAASIALEGRNPYLAFRNSSDAGNATVTIAATSRMSVGDAHVEFWDASSAADASFVIPQSSQSQIAFYDDATAGQATLTLQEGNGISASDSDILFFHRSTAGNSQIDVGRNRLLEFSSRSSTGNANITVRPRGAMAVFSVGGGAANIHLLGDSGSDFQGASLLVESDATVGDATIIVEGGAAASAQGAIATMVGRAGNATLIVNGGQAPGANGGKIDFYSSSDGTDVNGRLVVNEGGAASFFVWFGPPPPPADITIGSIEGAGTFNLAGNSGALIVGSRNADTTVSGVIQGDGGRLTKVGVSTLTLAGDNTYTGITTVDQGALSVTGSIVGDAVVNSGGTLKGTGTIDGTVAVNAGGLFAPGTSPGTITVGGLDLFPGGVLDFEIGGTRDHILVNGDVSLAGVLNISLLDDFVPTLGQSFALFEGNVGSISGAFSSVVAPIINGLTFDVTSGGGPPLLQVVLAPVVPEPASAALLVISLIMFAVISPRLPQTKRGHSRNGA